MRELILLLLIVAAGFAASGVAASFYQLITGKPDFQLKPRSDLQRLAAFGLSIVTGPAVLARNAIKAQVKGGQDGGYLAFALSVATLWSYVLGLFIVSVAVAA